MFYDLRGHCGLQTASEVNSHIRIPSESLLVLPRVDPGDDLLELPLGLARGEVGHVVVLRGGGHEPLGLDVDAGPDVVLESVHQSRFGSRFGILICKLKCKLGLK